MSFSDEEEIKGLLKEQQFYNVPIEKPKTKHLNNVGMLSELPFYDELNIIKTGKAFKSCSIEIKKDRGEKMNDPLAQLEASQPVIKDLFKD